MNTHIYDREEHPNKLHLIESLTDEGVAEFIAIYKKETGKDISDAEAREKGLNLVRFVQAVHHEIPQEEIREANRQYIAEQIRNILPSMQQEKIDLAWERYLIWYRGWEQYIYPIYHSSENPMIVLGPGEINRRRDISPTQTSLF